MMGRGCFLPCFGASSSSSSKNRKSQQRKPKPNNVPSADQSKSIIQNLAEIHGTCESVVLQPTTTSPTNNEAANNIGPITDSKDKHEDHQLHGSTKKKVTFDLNVKTYEEKEKEKKEEPQHENQTQSDSSTSSLFTYPPSHRYHNCTTSDDESESEDPELEEIDSKALAQAECSSESLFSLSIESRNQVLASEIDEREVNSPMKPIGLNPNARDRSKYVDSVLNPVENLTQWKRVKLRASTPLKDQEKENINLEQKLCIPFSEEPSFKYVDSVENLTKLKEVKLRISTPLKDQEKENINLEQDLSIPFSEEPSFKLSNRGFSRPKPEFSDIAVDTSLSSWLVESQTTKNSPNSVGNSPEEGANSLRSWEDRPILGALTVEELKLSAASSSPRRSPSRSPEEVPIIGTVGSFWNHTGKGGDSDSGSSRGMPSTTSKFREDKRGKWHCTPFETRLERALDRGIAEV